MERVPTIAGWVVGILLLIGLLPLVPAPSCRDGWDSPSIGRRGACSHHGGVERHGELALLIVAASFGAGLFTTAQLSGIVERRKKARFFASLVPPGPDAPTEKIILYAILSESKIEFLYKGRNDFVPQLRIVTPTYSSVTRGQYGWSGAPCIVGHCHTRNACRTFVLDRISALKLHGA